jgi:asparagine synthase (glutamine-hydrolysing)
MCGIFGWLGQAPVTPQALFATLSPLLQHRGPDDQGFEHGPGWGFGFRRLSILDLSALGHQPMSSQDGRFWLIFNGEIYNYLELRAALEQEGETFQGSSDTEVLLRLLALQGAEALPRLNGMFALAFVDTLKRTFILARDRLGKKPLYYHSRAGHLRFASELKALLAWPDAPRQLNPQAVVEYLTFSYLPHESCIFQEYQKVPPAHYLSGSLDEPEQAKAVAYWRLNLTEEVGDGLFTERDQDTLLDLLTDAVRIRLRSDVPVGVFLSGGIDSGLVATLTTKANSLVRPLALTIGFAEETFDETELARATANQAGLEHRVIAQRPGGLNDIDRLTWFFDEPFGDPSALPTMTLCEAAAEHATVFLSGDGGDEAFGGYRRYIEAQRYLWLRKLPEAVRLGMRWSSQYLPVSSAWRYRLLKSSLPDAGLAAVFDGLGLADDPALKTILPSDLKPFLTTAANPLWQRWVTSQGQNILTRQQALDYALYLPDDILVKVDRASMAHSIEVRSPFLDYRLIEWAAQLPRATLMNAENGKLPLRTLAEVLLPRPVKHAVKRGFGAPLGSWFRQEYGRQFVRDRLLSGEARRRGLWDPKGVEHLLAVHQTGQGRDFGEILWRLLALDSWARHYLDDQRFLQETPQLEASYSN